LARVARGGGGARGAARLRAGAHARVACGPNARGVTPPGQSCSASAPRGAVMANDDSSSSGLRLIAAHLAQVKLEAAEKEYQFKTTVTRLERSLHEALDKLSKSERDVENYQAQIKKLQSENTYKALVAERAKWKSLIDTLRQDKQALAIEVSALRHKVGEDSPEQHSAVSERLGSGEGHGVREDDGDGDGSGDSSGNGELRAEQGGEEERGVRTVQRPATDARWVHGPEQSRALRQRFASDSEWIQLQGEVKFLRSEIESKNLEIQALRSKLDRELELKWELKHANQPHSWQKSLLESFAEVLAPYPSNMPESPPASPHKRRHLVGAGSDSREDCDPARQAPAQFRSEDLVATQSF